jgi:DNA primase
MVGLKYGAEMWEKPGNKPSVAVLVEGVVDALMVWQATRDFRDPYGFPVLPLALLGSTASREQADKLVQLSGDRRIIVFLDNDEAGRKGDGEVHALVGNRVRYHRAAYPEDAGGADPGSLPADQIRAAIANAKVILKGV